MLADALALDSDERDEFAAVARPASPRGPQQPAAARLPVPRRPWSAGRPSWRSRGSSCRSPTCACSTSPGRRAWGKTRLALAIAEYASPAAAVFVDLAPVADPRLVLAAVGRALGLPEVASDRPVTDLAGQLAGRRLLLVARGHGWTVAAGDGRRNRQPLRMTPTNQW
jgi:hypothetical protein